MSGRGKSQANRELIAAATGILAEIQPATVRAVCYRLFVAGLIGSMSKANTNRVSVQLRDAREDGCIPWEWIVDETRHAEVADTWKNPQQLIRSTMDWYRRDHWQGQPEWVEVWSEKGTVRGTLAPVLDQYGVTFRVMHGHGSATAIHEVAQMAANAEKRLTVLYVGDYDPSGMHMSETDLPDRLHRYGDGGNIDVIRIAIAKCDTTRKADVPSVPAADKTSDPRYKWFVERYGSKCWELDALSPPILRQRVEAEIIKRLDMAAWERSIEVESVEIDSIKTFLQGYPAASISGPAQKYGEAP